MQTFDLILEHWDTRQLMFITVEDCQDLDECLDHVRDNHEGFEVTQIRSR